MAFRVGPQAKMGKFVFPPRFSHSQELLNKGKWAFFLVPPTAKFAENLPPPPRAVGGMPL